MADGDGKEELSDSSEAGAAVENALVPGQSELSRAVEAAEHFIRASHASATLRAYESDWRDFEKWCAGHGLITLPSSPGTVAAYLSSMATGPRPAKLSTIRRRLAAIGYAHRRAGYENPSTDPVVDATIAGIARSIGSARTKKTALTAALVARILKPIHDDREGLRDRAIILLQFAAALRVSELVSLEVDDITRHPDGIVVTIRRSKSDQEGIGLQKAVPYGKRLRPVAALDAWLVAARITEGSLFRASARTVSRIIKRRCAAAGLDPKLFASHSLRSGFISSAAAEGAPITAIARHAGHAKLDTTMGYVQTADAFRDHAGKKIL